MMRRHVSAKCRCLIHQIYIFLCTPIAVSVRKCSENSEHTKKGQKIERTYLHDKHLARPPSLLAPFAFSGRSKKWSMSAEGHDLLIVWGLSSDSCPISWTLTPLGVRWSRNNNKDKCLGDRLKCSRTYRLGRILLLLWLLLFRFFQVPRPSTASHGIRVIAARCWFRLSWLGGQNWLGRLRCWIRIFDCSLTCHRIHVAMQGEVVWCHVFGT